MSQKHIQTATQTGCQQQHTLVNWVTAVARVCTLPLEHSCHMVMQSGCNGAKIIKEEIITFK